MTGSGRAAPRASPVVPLAVVGNLEIDEFEEAK